MTVHIHNQQESMLFTMNSKGCLIFKHIILYCVLHLFLFTSLIFSKMVLAAVAGIVGRTNASQNVRTACKKCGYGKTIVTLFRNAD